VISYRQNRFMRMRTSYALQHASIATEPQPQQPENPLR
jgi:hypothetical protein